MILSVRGLSKFFMGGFWQNKRNNILKDLNLSIKKGEVYAFLGLNGAGKTTTLECIMGIEKCNTGEINFFNSQGLNNTIRKRIGYAPDKVAYFDHLSGRENLMMIANYAGIEKNTREPVGQDLFKKLGLEYAKDLLVSNYSQGMRQRLGLIISLIGNPDFLIRDEPMNGLDPLGRIIVKELMKELQTQGKTILFSTHILSDVEEIADRFGILAQGHIIYEGDTKYIDGDMEDLFTKKLKITEREEIEVK